MGMPVNTPRAWRFGVFELDAPSGELRRNGTIVKLREQPARILLLLLENAGQMVTREQLREHLWPSNTFVDFDHSLNAAVMKLREVLGDSADKPLYIETIPRKGYRFVAPVSHPADTQNGGASSQSTAAPELAVYNTREQSNGGIEVPSKAPDEKQGRRTMLSRKLAVLILLIVSALGIAALIRSASLRSALTPMRVKPLTDLPGWAGWPALSPDGERLAFIWNNESPANRNLYVQLVGGDRPLQLTHTHSGFLCCPSWSPDGREIAIARCGDNGGAVYVVPALGGPERKLTDVVCHFGNGAYPKWSADAQSLLIADQCTRNGPPGIVRFSLVTGERQCLHVPPATDEGDLQPAISPDQKTVAFLKMPNADMTELFTVPISGGPARQITSDGHIIGSLMWSADGHRIVFNSNRNGSSRVWQVPATGGSIQPEIEYPEVGSLSRDGRRLAYEGLSGMSGCSSTIWRAELSRPGGPVLSQERILASLGFVAGTQLSSDRRQIVYQSGRSGPAQIWKSDADGSNPLQMTFFDNKGYPGTPRWSADDRWIAFDYHDPTHTQIYLVDSEGRNLHRITSGNYENIVPSWSRDGAFVYFASNRTGGWQVWKHALATGAETQVTHDGGLAAFEAYDAKTLYYSKYESGGIWRLTANGGEEQLTDALHVGDWGNFTVTEGGIYLVDSSTEPGPTILYYNFQNRRTTPVVMLKQDVTRWDSNLSSSRDGRTILYAQAECKGSILMAEKVP